MPDGHYVTQPLDQSGFFFGEFRDSVSGRAALRLRAPSDGNGTAMEPYTLPRLNASSAYEFSVWTKGAAGGEKMRFQFTTAIFPAQVVPAPGGAAAGGRGKWDGALQVVATREWKQTKLTVTTADDLSGACRYGCRSWLSYVLESKGDVLVDDLSLIRAQARSTNTMQQ